MDPSVGSADHPHLPIFLRLWGIALLAHVIGNWTLHELPSMLGWVNLGVGLAGLLLITRPARLTLLVGSVSVLASVLLEIPVTGNHWVVAGLVSAAALLCGGDPRCLFPAARLILIVFYAFAAFAKFNSGFFDPSVSCAVFYANQWLDGFGLGPLPTSSSSSRAIVWGSALIETMVPLLLLWRRSRPFGVLLASLFHILISWDLNQHFYDFTAVLLPLFFLFTGETTAARLNSLFATAPSRTWRVVTWLSLGAATALWIAAALPVTLATASVLTTVPFLLWIPLSLLWLYALVRNTTRGSALGWSIGWPAALVLVLTLLNGLSPYFEAKTAFSFNMYANLHTAAGESNHFLVTRTIPIREGYQGLVQIVDTTDPELELYSKRGYLLAYPQMRQYLFQHPDVGVTYIRFGSRYAIPRAGDDPAFNSPGPWWWRYFPLRAVDTEQPPRCQDVFLPAL